MRSLRFLAVSMLVLAFALSAAVIAFAAKPAGGKWGGKVNPSGVKLSFKVSKSGKRVKTFAVATLPVYCYAEGFTTEVFLIPSAKVRASGRFRRAYKTKDEFGRVDGTLTVSGRFKTARRASGKLDYQRGGCTSGKLNWSAKRKR